MKVVDKNSYVIVVCEEADVSRFNAEEHAAIHVDESYEHISFAFKKFSGDLLRVIPNNVRSGGLAWTRLADRARNYWRTSHVWS